MRAYRRYLLFQIPGVVLFTILVVAAARAFDLSAATIAVALVLWIAKDIALYPMLAKSYEQRKGPDRLVGSSAVVTEPLVPEGWVRAGGELWRARASSGSIPAGSEVRIVEVERLTLVVDAITPPPS